VSEMFFSIKDVSINYGTLEAVKSVSFDVPQGLIVSLLGANGAGKSTLFKAISGINKIVSGSMWFEGVRIDKLRSDEILRKGIAQVPEGKRIFPYMSVMENLDIGAISRKDGKKAIEETRDSLLERFPMLRQKARTRADKLSGGQQQILVIARALMVKPKLLLLDEPAQGVAPIVVADIAEVIRRINQLGVTIMVIEHNIRFVRGLAHKVFIMENGRLAYEGDPNSMSEEDLVKKIYLGG
jgi:branched-chain amino acid transport system ATP-binding protein